MSKLESMGLADLERELMANQQKVLEYKSILLKINSAITPNNQSNNTESPSIRQSLQTLWARVVRR